MSAAPARLVALDLARGVAVLGILAVNIAGFAGPIEATDGPTPIDIPAPFADEAAFAATFLIFEGKMRAIFSMLFGASMLLFVERAEARGLDGDALQRRRLAWLGVFGYLHYLLLWWGDILFLYALVGLVSLPLRHLSPRALAGLALAIFGLWHLWGMIESLPGIIAEQDYRLHRGAAGEIGHTAALYRDLRERIAGDAGRDLLPWTSQILDKLTRAPAWPLVMTLFTAAETLPLMLIGMALYKTGFFAGAFPVAEGAGIAPRSTNTHERWSARRLQALAGAGLGIGLPLALAPLAWAWKHHFPPLAMPDVLSYWAGPEHLALALAYLALLMIAAPPLAASALGQRLIACGRTAFTNYLATSLVMCAIFYGWGLGLHVAGARQWLFVFAGWAAMLAWSKPWLARYRQGPMEWAWRSLRNL